MSRFVKAALVLGVAPSCGTYCEHLEQATSHLRTVLAACPNPGDANITQFSVKSCEAKAGTACTAKEMIALDSVASCDETISVCRSPSDQSRAHQDIEACVGKATLSSECAAALAGP